MSIEEKIEDLTTAIDKLTEAVIARGATGGLMQDIAAAAIPKVDTSVAEEAPPAPANTEETPPAAPPKKKRASKKKAAPVTADTGAPQTNPDALKDLIAEVGVIAQKLGPRAVELSQLLNTKYNVIKVSELPRKDYDAFLADCQAMLES